MTDPQAVSLTAVATEVQDAPYPQHWEADVLLADGGVVHLRPSGPADAARSAPCTAG